MSQTINLGSVTAYASAVEGGYTGTYAEFCEATANVAEIGELQSATLPTPSEDRVGQVLQYIGDTTSDYIHGYFYECVENNGDFEWVNVSLASDKADKVSSATNNNFAALDANGNLKDSGHKHSDYLTSHQDISGKADKVTNATSGNLAGLDANGNLTDSGIDPTDLGGGHTILNSSGSALTQRSKLQFDGLNVTDDSGNAKTVVTAPTPDYVDEQYSSSTTYSKGMTCILGNKRYRYKNSTASSGHTPPNTTYWEELSIASQLEWKEIASDELTPSASVSGEFKYNIHGNNKTVSDLSKYTKFLLVLLYPIGSGKYEAMSSTMAFNDVFQNGTYIDAVFTCIMKSTSDLFTFRGQVYRSSDTIIRFSVYEYASSPSQLKVILYGA